MSRLRCSGRSDGLFGRKYTQVSGAPAAFSFIPEIDLTGSSETLVPLHHITMRHMKKTWNSVSKKIAFVLLSVVRLCYRREEGRFLYVNIITLYYQINKIRCYSPKNLHCAQLGDWWSNWIRHITMVLLTHFLRMTAGLLRCFSNITVALLSYCPNITWPF